MVSAMWKKRGLHWTVCGLVVFLMTTSVSAVVESLTMMSDVDTVTCAGDVSITDPQVCPGRSITFTCTTNETGALVWRTSAGGTDGILFFITDSVGSMGTVAGGGLAGFTANLTSVMGTLLTSTLTTAASDEVRGLQVTCLNGITVSAGSQSTDIPLFVEDSPSQPINVSATSDSLDCAAGTEDFTVAWQCPADTGGAAITNFTVSVDGGSPQTFMGTAAATSDPIPVAVNEQHSISVTASNCFGTGPPNTITVNPEAPVPSVPEDLQVTLNCQNMILNAITVTWNDPNTNLRCSVMSTTVDVDSGDISLSCSGTSSPSVCTGNITENAIYTATVEFSSSLPESQSNPSTSSDQIIGRRCTVDRTLRQMPGDCIQVTLDDWCEEDHTRYGVSVLNQDMSESGITRFDPSDTICVPIDPTETFSLRLYFDSTVLEEKSGITADSTSIPIWIVAPIVVGVLLLIATGALVGVCIYKQKRKYSLSDSHHPSPMYEDISSHNSPRDITLEDNVAYGPVTPQQPAVMYEEVSTQPERIEMSGNVAYGQISH